MQKSKMSSCMASLFPTVISFWDILIETCSHCRLSTGRTGCSYCWAAQLRKRQLHAASGNPSLIREIQRDLASKKRSAREITERYIDNLERAEPSIGSFLALSTQEALGQADSVDKAIAAGEQIGPLAGVPIAIKVQPDFTNETEEIVLRQQLVSPFEQSVSSQSGRSSSVPSDGMSCDTVSRDGRAAFTQRSDLGYAIK